MDKNRLERVYKIQDMRIRAGLRELWITYKGVSLRRGSHNIMFSIENDLGLPYCHEWRRGGGGWISYPDRMYRHAGD